MKRKTLLSLFADRRGVAAIELGIVVPVLALLVAGSIEVGNALYQQFQLNSAVTSASNYAIVNSSQVNATNGGTLASNIATIVESSYSAGWANVTVVVNDGPATTVTSGSSSSSGTASNAGFCYCPTGTASSTTWGASVTCGSSCGSGGTGGKFVTIVATKAYTPFFSSYGFVTGNLTASALVQVQ